MGFIAGVTTVIGLLAGLITDASSPSTPYKSARDVFRRHSGPGQAEEDRNVGNVQHAPANEIVRIDRGSQQFTKTEPVVREQIAVDRRQLRDRVE